MADTVLYLSYYFDTNALSVRLSWFWVSMTMTSILGSFLAAGLLALRGKGGLEGWRWLFMIEGIITFLIGVWAYFYLPAGPTQTAGGIRGKGWFTEYVPYATCNLRLAEHASDLQARGDHLGQSCHSR